MKHKLEMELDVPKLLVVMDVAEEFPTFIEMNRLDNGLASIEVKSPNAEAVVEAGYLLMECVRACVHALGSGFDLQVAMYREVQLNGSSEKDKPFE